MTKAPRILRPVFATFALAGCPYEYPGDVEPDAMGVDAVIDAAGTDAAADAWPDGGPGCHQRLAFASNRAGSNYEIYLINVDATGIVPLTNHSAADRDPQWSPNGTTILFSTDRDGNGEIYSISVTGTGTTNLTMNGAEDKWPRWSPNGATVAFVRGGNIWRMSPTGTSQTQLTTSGDIISPPVWSPDGNLIATVRSIGGDLEVATVNVSTQQNVNLTNSPGTDSLPSWSSTGDRIAFISVRVSGSNIWAMNANGSSPTQLTNNLDPESDPHWSPLGGVIAYSRVDGLAEVYTMGETGTDQVNRSLNATRSDRPQGWSSDGSLLAVDGGGSVYVMPPDGAFLRNVSNANMSTDEFGSFSPPCP